jgi:hypothetical protein
MLPTVPILANYQDDILLIGTRAVPTDVCSYAMAHVGALVEPIFTQTNIWLGRDETD